MRVRAFEQLEILTAQIYGCPPPRRMLSAALPPTLEQFSDGLLMGFTQLFTGVLTILGTLGVMLFIDWRVTFTVPVPLRVTGLRLRVP